MKAKTIPSALWLCGAIVLTLVAATLFAPPAPIADDKQEKIVALLDRGNELARKGDLDGALSEYKKVLALDPGNALAHNNLGIIYKRKGLYITAVEEFQQSLASLPNYYKTYNNLANVYAERGYYDEAIKYYNKCLAVKPNFADAHWNLALAYEKTGEKTRAIRHFKQFIDLSDAPTYVALAQQHIDALSAPPAPAESRDAEKTYPIPSSSTDPLGY